MLETSDFNILATSMPTVAHTPLVAVRKLPADDDMDNGISNHPLCVILHSAENQEIADELRSLAYEGVDVERIVDNCILKDENYRLIQAWGTVADLPYVECWYAPEEALEVPENYVSTELPLPEPIKQFLKSMTRNKPK